MTDYTHHMDAPKPVYEEDRASDRDWARERVMTMDSEQLHDALTSEDRLLRQEAQREMGRRHARQDIAASEVPDPAEFRDRLLSWMGLDAPGVRTPLDTSSGDKKAKRIYNRVEGWAERRREAYLKTVEEGTRDDQRAVRKVRRWLS